MALKENKISCIIAAYNEGPRIGTVLDTISNNSRIDEIIVVDDGSKDNTKEVVEKYSNIQLISYYQNKGKTFAVMTGLLRAKNDVVMLIDADLMGLTNVDIDALISPVKSGTADVAISIKQNSLSIYKMLGIDFVSGERVFNKKMIPDINMLANLPKFGLEVFMNNIIIKNHLKIKIVKWNSVNHARKSEKMGWWQGNIHEVKMFLQILKTVKISKLIFQIKHMRALRIK